ncbi:MAG: Rho termination factor N-terminal domain-containing protein, partial [Clostridium sp.]|nr:Rho termination factor N-terminal domain-containing protein [Clostridium sp.]
MYVIDELKEMAPEQISAIAKEFGIKDADSAQPNDLVFKILDHQATEASKKPQPEKKSKRGRKPKAQAEQAAAQPAAEPVVAAPD